MTNTIATRPNIPPAEANPANFQLTFSLGAGVSSNNLKSTNLNFGAFQFPVGAQLAYRWGGNLNSLSLNARASFPYNNLTQPSWLLALAYNRQFPLYRGLSLVLGGQLYVNAFYPSTTVTPPLGHAYRASATVMDVGLGVFLGLRFLLPNQRNIQLTLAGGSAVSRLDASAQVAADGTINGGVILTGNRFPTDAHHTAYFEWRASATLAANCMIRAGAGCFGLSVDASYGTANYFVKNTWTTDTSHSVIPVTLTRVTAGASLTYTF